MRRKTGKVLAVIFEILAIISVCAMDSDSWIPMAGVAISLLGFVVCLFL